MIDELPKHFVQKEFIKFSLVFNWLTKKSFLWNKKYKNM